MKFIVVVVFAFTCCIPSWAQAERTLRVFIRAGTKSHLPTVGESFLTHWQQLLNDRGAVATSAPRFPKRAELEKTDVLILHGADSATIGRSERQNLTRFLQRGGGIVVIHDGLAGNNSEWFKTIIGGAWGHGKDSKISREQTGLIGLYFGDYPHAISAGVSNFDLEDAMFYPIHLAPGARVIASTFHTAKEVVPQIWSYEGEDYRAFVSVPGHNQATFELPHYRGLLLRGIAWAGQRDVDLLLNTEERSSFRYPDGGPTAPELADKKIQVNEEFDLKLIAAEPLVVNPISLDWDPRGRLWVAVTPEYPFKVDDSPAKDSILILADSNNDGRMDERQVFADGLKLVTSFVFFRDGVIVAQAPRILLLRDTDGDGKADRNEVLFDGFGTDDTHAVISNLRWGMDGWIYGTQGYSGNKSEKILNRAGQSFGKIGNGIFRFRPDGSAMEAVASYGGNSWGLDFRWDGELFFSKANGPHISHLVLPEKYFLRGRIGGAASDKSIEDHQKVYPLYGDTRHEYIQVAPVGVFTAASGAMIYEGGAWPEKFHSSYFVAEPTVHIVHEDVISTTEGSPTYEATKHEQAEFIAGKDLWFRPVHLRFGPDGAMYVLDFYNQAISHNDIRGITHGPGKAAVRPDRDHQHGRIWRVQHQQARPLDNPALAEAAPADMVKALEHPNGWVRMTAQRMLMEKGDVSIAPELLSVLHSNRQAHARVHALWTLHHLKVLDEESLLIAIADPHWAVQRNALQIVASGDVELTVPVEQTVIKQISSDSERVRLFALMALGQGPPRKEIVRPVLKPFPDLKDAWTKSVVLYVAALDPVAFMKGALTSDKPDSYVDLATKLMERVAIDRKETDAAEMLVEATSHAEKKDKLKIAILEGLRLHMGPEFAPDWSENFGKALTELLSSKNRLVRVAAIPVAARYQDDKALRKKTRTVTEKVFADLGEAGLKEDDRTQLLTSLISIPDLQEEVMTAADALLKSGASPKIQRHIISEFGRTSLLRAGEVLVRNYGSLNQESRTLAFNTLAKRDAWTQRLLDALEKGGLRVQQLGPLAVSRLRNYPDPRIAQRARQIIDGLQGPQVKEKEKLIARFRRTVEQPADLTNGQALFTQNCATCHRLNGKGSDLGPDLTGTGWHGSAVLLTHILDPNRAVEGNFIPYNVTTKKDEEYNGLIARENRDSVTLRNVSGEVELRRADIQTMSSSGLSLMPEGLEVLGGPAIRDIVAYIVNATPKGYRPLDLTAAFSADSRKGLYAEHTDAPQLELKKFGLVTVDGIPFVVADPATTPDGQNLIVLKGGTGFAKTFPQRVEIPIGSKAYQVHILGGIAGWGFPYGELDGHYVPAVKVVFRYADGRDEEVILRNGEEFADYNRQIEVPGSRHASGLVEKGQLRCFSLTPKRDVPISAIILESYDNHLAPTFVALTVQVEDRR